MRIPVLPDCLLSEAERNELKGQEEPMKCDAIALLRNRGPLDGESIEALDLSVRSFNCMMRAEISSYGTFRAWCERRGVQDRDELISSFFKIRNLGRRSMEEVLANMEECGWLDFLD